MIRFRLRELIAEKSFNEGRRVTYDELSKVTGINRTTLSKLSNQKGYSTTTENLDRLCSYFDCRLEELAEFIPNNSVKEPEE